MLLSSNVTWLQQKPLIGSLHGAKPQLLCMTPSVLGHQLQLRLHLCQWSPMASHSAELQLLCIIPSCLQNQYHLGDYITKSSCQHKVQLRLPLEHSFSVLSGNTSQRISP